MARKPRTGGDYGIRNRRHPRRAGRSLQPIGPGHAAFRRRQRLAFCDPSTIRRFRPRPHSGLETGAPQSPALETLAIIAYRQPITKADIEAVRGVSVDGVLQKVIERGLVKIGGRADVPGRPLLYETTDFFLEHFGVRSLNDLPNAEELRNVPLATAQPKDEGHQDEQLELAPRETAENEPVEVAEEEARGPEGSEGPPREREDEEGENTENESETSQHEDA